MTRLASTVAILALAIAAVSCSGADAPPSPTRLATTGTPLAQTITPVATPSPTPDTGRAVGSPAEQLLYVGTDQSLWIYDTERGTQSKIVAGGVCASFFTPHWNRDGSKFAVTCGPGVSTDAFIFSADGTQLDHLAGYGAQGWSPAADVLLLDRVPADPQVVTDDTAYALYDLAAPSNARISDLPNVTSGVLFSPDGPTVALYRTSDAACAPACKTGLVLRDVATGAERALGDLYPASWLRDDHTLLVLADYERRTISLANDAFLLDVATGARTAIPALNGQQQFWLTNDSSKLIVLTFTTDIGLAILDLSTQQTAPITGSSIHYPSEGIPGNQVAPSGDQVFWFDATGAPSAWYVANIDGSGLTKLGQIDGYFLTFSPSRSFVAYPRATNIVDPATGAVQSNLIVSTINATRTVDLGPASFPLAWRPPPAP